MRPRHRRRRSRASSTASPARKDIVEIQLEEIRDQTSRIMTTAREEREAFLSYYETKREFHDRLSEQLEALLAEEQRLLSEWNRESSPS